MRGFGDVVESNELMRGFGRSRGTLLLVIAVAGWSGSGVFRLRLWVGCRGSGSVGIVYVGRAIVGNRVIGVGDVAAVAAAVAVVWWGGVRYVAF